MHGQPIIKIKMDIRDKSCGWMELTQDRVQWRVISYRGCWANGNRHFKCYFAVYLTTPSIPVTKEPRMAGYSINDLNAVVAWCEILIQNKKSRTPADIRTDDLPNTSQQRYRLSWLVHIYTYNTIQYNTIQYNNNIFTYLHNKICWTWNPMGLGVLRFT